MTAALEKLPLLALSLLSSILTVLSQQAGGALEALKPVSLATRSLVASRSLVVYLVKMVAPVNLAAFYPYPENVSPTSLDYLGPLVLVVGMTAACVLIASTHRLWLSLWAVYVVTLIPVLGIVQVGSQAMADRYTYLPSLGPFLLLGLGTAKIYERATRSTRWRAGAPLAAVSSAGLMILALASATRAQIGVWQNSFVFWEHVLAQEPARIPAAYNNLGEAYHLKGDTDKALALYETAVKLDPGYAAAYNNLGEAHRLKGDPDKARTLYETAVKLDSGYGAAHNNLGIVFAAQGQGDRAIAHYQTALRLKPDYAEAYSNLGEAYRSQGRMDLAIANYQIALQLNPDYAEAHNNLGVAHDSRGETALALTHYQAAVKLNPGYAEAHNNLGTLYHAQGRTALALEQLNTALRLKPDYVDAHNNLGIIYLKSGSRDLARREFESVLRSAPDNAIARQFLRVLNAN